MALLTHPATRGISSKGAQSFRVILSGHYSSDEMVPSRLGGQLPTTTCDYSWYIRPLSAKDAHKGLHLMPGITIHVCNMCEYSWYSRPLSAKDAHEGLHLMPGITVHVCIMYGCLYVRILCMPL